MDRLLANIQSARNSRVPVLYGNDLQFNTGIYFRPEQEYLKTDVPRPPTKLFSESGATVELDRSPMISVTLNVPRNAEIQALNEYFSQKRLVDFSRSQQDSNLSETLAKQSELLANTIISDEMGRRSGIRRAVLDATGLTPAQVQVQMAQEQLGAINGRVMDMRDRQIQDAVGLYYSINNLPIPVTTLQSNDQVGKRMTGEEVTQEEAGLRFDDGQNVEEEEQPAEDIAGDIVSRRVTQEQSPAVRQRLPRLPIPMEVPQLSREILAELIIGYAMRNEELVGVRGNMPSFNTLKNKPKRLLEQTVLAYLSRIEGVSGAEGVSRTP